MKKTLLFLALVLTITTYAFANESNNSPVSEVKAGYYYIVTAGNGPGYSGEPYNNEYNCAMYNENGFVKWDYFDYSKKYVYLITPKGDNWLVKNVVDGSYINKGITSYGCNVTTSETAESAQEFILVNDNKYAIRAEGTNYVYSLEAGHNGSTSGSGALNIWGTPDEAETYGVNVWYLIPASGNDTSFVEINSKTVTLSNTDNTSYNSKQLKCSVITTTDSSKVSVISWTSLNPDVVTVEDGLIKAVSVGETIITATATIDGQILRDSCLVKVENSILALNAHKANLYIVDTEGLGSKTLTSTISPAPLADVAIEWTSSDTAVATVVDGQVKAIGAGTATITASAVVGGITISDSLSLSVNAAQEDTRYVFVETAGTLSNLISADEKYDITSLVVGGELNSSDMAFLKDMAGRDGSGNVSAGCLRRLDMSTATLASGAEVNFNSCGSIQQVAVPENTKTIPYQAFRSCSSLRKVELNDELTEIGNSAFQDCSNITEITIPSTVTSIGENAFYNDSKLAKVNIPEDSKLSTIGNWAFSECSALKSIYIPKGIKAIPDWCFSRASIGSITFAQNSELKTIGEGAFFNCNELAKIFLPESVTLISEQAFMYCHSLQEFNIPDNSLLTSISNQAFYCSGIKQINFPASLVSIGSEVFAGNDVYGYCTNLTTVTFSPNSRLVSIGVDAFNNCNHLQTFALPWRTTTVSESAFSGCTSLTEFTIPENSRLTSLGTNALSGTRIQSLYIPADLASIDGSGYLNFNLREITADADNLNYFTKDGVLYNKSTGALLAFPQSKSGAWTTPSFLTTLPVGALQNCSQISSVTLSAEIDSIGSLAFNGCAGLKSLLVQTADVPQTATDAFNGVGKGTTLVFVPSEAVETYKADKTWGAFRMLQAFPTEAYIYLSDSTLTLYDTQSPEPRQKDLSAIVVTPQGASDAQITWTTSNDSVITVSDGHVELLQPGSATITASALVGDTTIFSTCSVLGVGFEAGQSVYYIATPGTLTDVIPQFARDTITNLKLFGYINGTDLSEIRRMAGGLNYDATNTNAKLTILDLGDVIIRSGGDTYHVGNIYGLSYWEQITSDNGVNGGMFLNCWKLEKVVMPQTLVTLGNATFAECTNLQSVTMPNNTTDIPAYTFYNCSNLTEINNVDWADIHSIGDYALSGSGIEEIHINRAFPAILGGTNIINTDKQVVVVPAAALETYRTADNWSSFYQNIVPDDAQLDIIAEVTAEDGGSGILTAIGEKAASYLTRLTLKGSINSYDFMLFRNKMPNLHYLDLTETTIEANPYEFVTGCYTEINRLPKQAFKDFSKLLEIKLPNSITYIGKSAFVNCQNLRRVTTYPGIITIDQVAFNNCTSLKEISFEKGLSGINEGAFGNCTSLKHISLPEGLLSIKSASYGDVDDVWYSNFGTFYNCSFDSIAIPSTVTEIGTYAFYLCKNLKYISLSKNLAKINGDTFQGCSSLQSIVLPSKVTSIDGQAFYGCSSLKELRIPPMVETIGNEAFKDCPIKDVYVYVANSKDVAINQNTFSCWSTATLHVPDFATASYYWNTQWSQFVNITEFSDTYESFYTKNDITLDSETGTIKGTPDATLHEESGLIVNDDEKQDLGDVELIHDGENGASVIPEKEGNVTANRARIRIHVTANRWHFFCFPFDIDLDSLQYDGQYVWRQYDGLRRSRREGGWQNLPEGTTRLTKWRGYIFQGTTTGDLVLTVIKPDFTSKDVDSHLEVYTSDNAVDASWNFVGNPYQSYYSIDKTTYDAPITVWTGSRYESYRPGDDDYEFSPYQAFFVQTSEDNDAVGFRADCRESYLESQQSLAKARAFRSAQYVKPDRLLFNLTLTHQGDSTYTDRTRIVFNDRKSLAYEVGCDAAKFFSTQRSAELFSTDAQSTQYSINERPVGEGRVDLSLVVNKAGTYSISGERMDAPALLIDNLNGVSHDLTLGAYEFSAQEGTLSNRFTLVLRDDLTGIESITAKTGAQISLHNGVSISGVDSGVQTRLYSIDGRLAGSITGQGTIAAPEGVYILRVGAMSTKIKIE